MCVWERFCGWGYAVICRLTKFVQIIWSSELKMRFGEVLDYGATAIQLIRGGI